MGKKGGTRLLRRGKPHIGFRKFLMREGTTARIRKGGGKKGTGEKIFTNLGKGQPKWETKKKRGKEFLTKKEEEKVVLIERENINYSI